MKKIHVIVYGRKTICPSCIGAPGSKDTYEWLQAAIGRKYGEKQFTYEYVDLDHHENSPQHQQMITKIEEEELFYPLVVMNDEIVAEGIPRLKTIFQTIESASQS